MSGLYSVVGPLTKETEGLKKMVNNNNNPFRSQFLYSTCRGRKIVWLLVFVSNPKLTTHDLGCRLLPSQYLEFAEILLIISCLEQYTGQMLNDSDETHSTNFINAQ